MRDSAADRTHSVRLVQCEPEPLRKSAFVGQIGTFSYAELRKINRLAEAARVDIAGVASSILATPTIFLLGTGLQTQAAGHPPAQKRSERDSD